MFEQQCPELEQQDQMLWLIKSSMHGPLWVHIPMYVFEGGWMGG
jgi:hypothetical protein